MVEANDGRHWLLSFDRGGFRCQESVREGPDIRLGYQNSAAVTDHIRVAVDDEVVEDVLLKVEEMMEKLKSKNVSLQGKLVAKMGAPAQALIVNIWLQRNRKKAVEKKENIAHLLIK